MNLKEINPKDFFKKYQVAINTMNFDELQSLFADKVKTQMVLISDFSPETEIESKEIIKSWKTWIPKLTSFQHIYSNARVMKETDSELIIQSDSDVMHTYNGDSWSTRGKMIFLINSDCKIESMLNVIENQTGDYTLIEKVITGE